MKAIFDPDWTGKKTGDQGEGWMEHKGHSPDIRIPDCKDEHGVILYDALERPIRLIRRIGYRS